jgi:hypothetical protein
VSFVLGLLVGLPVGFVIGVGFLLARAAHKLARAALDDVRTLRW